MQRRLRSVNEFWLTVRSGLKGGSWVAMNFEASLRALSAELGANWFQPCYGAITMTLEGSRQADESTGSHNGAMCEVDARHHSAPQRVS
jgi:hypothetical protein